MAQEKHLPNDTISLHVTEIKGVISNRNAGSNKKEGDSFPESMEYKSRRQDPAEAMDSHTQAICPFKEKADSERRSNFSRLYTLQNPLEKNPKRMSLGYL